jgi:hypothetical protein
MVVVQMSVPNSTEAACTRRTVPIIGKSDHPRLTAAHNNRMSIEIGIARISDAKDIVMEVRMGRTLIKPYSK